ncbi:Putative uncharacterized protein /Sporulation protein [Thermobacillus xylanilyticus]|jgi:hypothetical protein|uniref:Sporulation protein YtrH n=2 Tax=Thermobacillus TaxID=76632 RepID=L0EGA3_THECK|nr:MULTISPECIES: YtrH family sporulation protein [Thermobacillus]AGA58716.1 hypothetical protein Theco_2622 [Thermobacillus composti KWC4]REJ13559.1 MAG: sporulation protein [Paenibacillaceae bacterium]CAG5091929.1 Putative uncharacterized protein /Sporulation protein [Thermobacillus xylanilyticus]
MIVFLSTAVIDFFIAFGVIIGGSLLAAIGAVFVSYPPASTMLDTAMRLKIWAIVVAIGGTIDPVRVIEANVTEGHLSPAVQQILLIACAFLGAHLGTELIRWIVRGGL